MCTRRSLLTSLGAAGVLLAFAAFMSYPSPAVGAQGAAQERGGQDMYGPYEVVENWLQPLPDESDGLKHEGWTWGSQAAVYAETPDRIWVAQHGELTLPKGAKPWTPYAQISPSPGAATGPRLPNPSKPAPLVMRYHHVITVVNRDGKMVQWWQQHDKLFDQPTAPLGPRGPHKIKMSPYDPQKHVWVVDDNLHQIFKFTYDGKLVMTLGQMGVEGRGPNTFARPTDIAWLPDGTFFIADGYAGTRVAKFDPSGRFLLDWGKVPADPAKPGPNEFYSVHSIGVSRDRRVFVSDREHSRMQVFDENGKLLAIWPTGHRAEVYSHIVTEDDHVWVADHTTSRLVKYDLDGRYLYDMGGPGPLPGQFNGVHQISVDQERNLYVTEVWNGRTQKLRPKPNADPGKIVGPPVGGWPPSD